MAPYTAAAPTPQTHPRDYRTPGEQLAAGAVLVGTGNALREERLAQRAWRTTPVVVQGTGVHDCPRTLAQCNLWYAPAVHRRRSAPSPGPARGVQAVCPELPGYCSCKSSWDDRNDSHAILDSSCPEHVLRDVALQGALR